MNQRPFAKVKPVTRKNGRVDVLALPENRKSWIVIGSYVPFEGFQFYHSASRYRLDVYQVYTAISEMIPTEEER